MVFILKRLWKRHKVITLAIAILISIILMASGAKIWFYINFLLGSDIIVKLDTEQENLFLTRGEEEIVKFKASVTTNPFCIAECEYSFKDISQNREIEKDKFTLRPGKNLEVEYNLKATKLGEGQELYRFDGLSLPFRPILLLF